MKLHTDLRADLIEEDKLSPSSQKQLLTYLRLADKRLGLLINFKVALIRDGIVRIVNGLAA